MSKLMLSALSIIDNLINHRHIATLDLSEQHGMRNGDEPRRHGIMISRPDIAEAIGRGEYTRSNKHNVSGNCFRRRSILLQIQRLSGR